jgi:hypothetical protein
MTIREAKEIIKKQGYRIQEYDALTHKDMIRGVDKNGEEVWCPPGYWNDEYYDDIEFPPYDIYADGDKTSYSLNGYNIALEQAEKLERTGKYTTLKIKDHGGRNNSEMTVWSSSR